MASNPVIHARVPGPALAKARRVLKKSGLTTSDIVRSMVLRIADEGAIPVELFRPNATTRAAIQELESGGGHTSNSVKELFEALDADD